MAQDQAQLIEYVNQAYQGGRVDRAKAELLLKDIGSGKITTLDQLRMRVFQGAPRPNPTGFTKPQNNASGESAASLEALHRNKVIEFLILDKSGKIVRTLIGPDAVDFDPRHLRPGQSFAMRPRGTTDPSKITILTRR